VGIYRVEGPDYFTVIADIGTWAIAHPPETEFSVPTGVQYAIEAFGLGFLVTDGHHNRVLHVTLDGVVSEMIAFDDIVPTGLEVQGNTIFMAEAGPNPHLPADGKVVSFGPGSTKATDIASGGRLLVDVELGCGTTMFALAQGFFDPTHDDGTPANPNTGELLKHNGHGGFDVVASELDRPTSMELIGTTAYVATLGGEIWKVANVPSPHFGCR
jgi:hypothetical protein